MLMMGNPVKEVPDEAPAGDTAAVGEKHATAADRYRGTRGRRPVWRRAHDRLAVVARPRLSYLRSRLSGTERFGEAPLISGRLRLEAHGRVLIGDRFRAEGLAAPVSIYVTRGANLEIGDDFYMNGGACIEVWHDVKIGNHVLMAPFSSIIDDDRHPLEPGQVLYKGPTVVGDNVWLGRNVAVLPGVTIGSGSAIGANSVVTRDIPPSSFAVGAPARVIRKLEIPPGWVRP